MDKIAVEIPGNIQELVRCLGKATPCSKLIAGGTDYIISMQKGQQNRDMIIDLSGVKEIRGISMDGQHLIIGAGTTFTEIHNSPEVIKYARCLAEAASRVGSTQIRNRATIGGNIANASPAADSVPPLLAMNAEAELVSSEGKFYVKPLGELFSASGRTALSHAEAIVNIRIPILPEKSTSAFVKIGSRSTVTISKISMAIVLVYDEEKRIKDAGIALGAVGRTAYRATAVEQSLINKKLELKLGDFMGEQLSGEIESSLKGRSSMPYKKEAVMGLCHDAFAKLV